MPGGDLEAGDDEEGVLEDDEAALLLNMTCQSMSAGDAARSLQSNTLAWHGSPVCTLAAGQSSSDGAEDLVQSKLLEGKARGASALDALMLATAKVEALEAQLAATYGTESCASSGSRSVVKTCQKVPVSDCMLQSSARSGKPTKPSRDRCTEWPGIGGSRKRGQSLVLHRFCLSIILLCFNMTAGCENDRCRSRMRKLRQQALPTPLPRSFPQHLVYPSFSAW